MPQAPTNSVNGEPKSKYDGAPVRSVLGDKGNLVKDTGANHNIDAAQHAHAHEDFFLAPNRSGRRPQLGPFLRHSALFVQGPNAAVLNRVAMGREKVHNRVQGNLRSAFPPRVPDTALDDVGLSLWRTVFGPSK